MITKVNNMEVPLANLMRKISQFFSPPSKVTVVRIERELIRITSGQEGLILTLRAFEIVSEPRSWILLLSLMRKCLLTEVTILSEEFLAKVILELYRLAVKSKDASNCFILSNFLELISITYVRLWRKDKLSLLKQAHQDFQLVHIMLLLSKLPSVVAKIKSTELTIPYRTFLVDNIFPLCFELAVTSGLSVTPFSGSVELWRAWMEVLKHWFRLLAHPSTEISERLLLGLLSEPLVKAVIPALLGNENELINEVLDEILHFCKTKHPNGSEFVSQVEDFVLRILENDKEKSELIYLTLISLFEWVPNQLKKSDRILFILFSELEKGDFNPEIVECLDVFFDQTSEGNLNLYELKPIMESITMKFLFLLEKNTKSDLKSEIIKSFYEESCSKKSVKHLCKHLGKFAPLFDPFEFCYEKVQKLEQIPESVFLLLNQVCRYLILNKESKISTSGSTPLISFFSRKEAFRKILEASFLKIINTSIIDITDCVSFASRGLEIIEYFPFNDLLKEELQKVLPQLHSSGGKKVQKKIVKLIGVLLEKSRRDCAWLEAPLENITESNSCQKIEEMIFEVRVRTRVPFSPTAIEAILGVFKQEELVENLKVISSEIDELSVDLFKRWFSMILTTFETSMRCSMISEQETEKIVQILVLMLKKLTREAESISFFEPWKNTIAVSFLLLRKKSFACIFYFLEIVSKTFKEDISQKIIANAVNSAIEIVKDKIASRFPLSNQYLEDFFSLISTFSKNNKRFLFGNPHYIDLLRFSVGKIQPNSQSIEKSISFLNQALDPIVLVSLEASIASEIIFAAGKSLFQAFLCYDLSQETKTKIRNLIEKMFRWYSDIMLSVLNSIRGEISQTNLDNQKSDGGKILSDFGSLEDLLHAN